eukprot:TRINITY_DN2462_c0_g1_i3.p2 TRINITY_DN2462_c0_g1~~TRINITY_DN2462_c0_g1_i3.p2  ORF type:complete len:160 (-),score=29.29 TRINITY_DN2462_c0_g1_i3:79-522(-)
MTDMASSGFRIEDAQARWFEVIKNKDLDRLRAMLSEDVEFRSPVVYKPYRGADAAMTLLSNVMVTFEGLHYVRSWHTTPHSVHADRGRHQDLLVEFEAKIGGASVQGVDFIRFDTQSGKIVRFDVMVRPYSGMTALKDAMGKRLAAL